MFTWVFVVAALIAAAAILYFKARAAGAGFVSGASVSQLWRQPPRHDHRPALQRTDFRAVSIACGTGACKAARVLAGKRGFPNQIPRLPLSQCDAEQCTCTYASHADRRENDDRRRLYATVIGADHDASERRYVFDRRRDGESDADTDLETFNFRRES